MMKHCRYKIVTAVLYVVFCCILVFAISQKENYHVDEIFSYGLANHKSDGAANMKVKKGKVYEDSHAPYRKYMTVSKERRFDYKSVWENQKNDVHPPFYYVILHTISSFFPGRFSPWFAGIINIGFALLTLFMVRKLVLYLIDDEVVCLLSSIGFVLNSGIISATTFFRMYVITMFWGIVLAYLFLRLMYEEAGIKRFGLLYVTTVLAALTHYYCIVLVVAMSVVFGMYLFVKKAWSKLWKLCLTMILAAGTSLLAFPAMWSHIFSGYRGEEAIENLKNGLDFWTRIKSFFGFVNVQLFGSCMGCLLLILFLVMVCNCCLKNENDTKREIKCPKEVYVLLFLPLMIYFILISKVAAFVADRYLFPLYGVGFVMVLCWAYHLLLMYFNRRQGIFLLCIIIALMTYGSWKEIGWPYLYQGTDSYIESLEEYEDVDCVFVYEKRFQILNKYREVGCYDSVTFLKDDDLSKLPEYEEPCTELIVIINSPNTHTAYLDYILQKYPTLTSYKTVSGMWDEKTYYFW